MGNFGRALVEKDAWTSDYPEISCIHDCTFSSNVYEIVISWNCSQLSGVSKGLFRISCKGVGGLGYGWGSGKSGIWIKSFLYIKFCPKVY